MLIHDDVFVWEGFGGKLRLGSGKCRLRIFHLEKTGPDGLTYLRPFIVVASDISESRMTVKSCVSHIATSVVKAFDIKPNRMVFVEFYPRATYGSEGERVIPERFDAVDFTWLGHKALHPRWRALEVPLLDIVREYVHSGESKHSAP